MLILKHHIKAKLLLFKLESYIEGSVKPEACLEGYKQANSN